MVASCRNDWHKRIVTAGFTRSVRAASMEGIVYVEQKLQSLMQFALNRSGDKNGFDGQQTPQANALVVGDRHENDDEL